MSGVVEDVEIRADTSSAESAAKRFEGSLVGAFVKGQIAADALRKATDFLVQSIQDGIAGSLESERVTLSMQAGMRAYGLDVQRTSDLLDGQASKLSMLSGVEDDHIRKLQAQALNLGINEERIDDVVRASITLANVTGDDLDSAYDQMLRSLDGVTRGTIKLIPGIGELTEEQLRSGDAIRLINERLGSNLDLLNEGASGALNQAKLAWGEFGETLGGLVTKSELFSGTLKFIADYLTVINEEMSKGNFGAAIGIALSAPFSGDVAGRVADQAYQTRASTSQGAASSADFKRGMDFSGSGGLVRANMGRTPLDDSLADIDRQFALGANSSSDLGRADDMVMVNGHLMPAERADRMAELGRRIQEGQIEITRSNQERLTDIYTREGDRRLAIEEMQNNKRHEMMTTMQSTATSLILEGLKKQAEGQDVTVKQMVNAFLWSVGEQLVARGTADALIAAGMILTNNYAQGMPLLQVAGEELAVGGAMIAAGYATSKAGWAPSRGKNSATASANPADAYAGGSGKSSGTSNSGGEDRPIIINFYGPTTAPEVGIAIRKALTAADNMGYRQ
jgi:hypothetical protein